MRSKGSSAANRSTSSIANARGADWLVQLDQAGGGSGIGRLTFEAIAPPRVRTHCFSGAPQHRPIPLPVRGFPPFPALPVEPPSALGVCGRTSVPLGQPGHSSRLWPNTTIRQGLDASCAQTATIATSVGYPNSLPLFGKLQPVRHLSRKHGGNGTGAPPLRKWGRVRRIRARLPDSRIRRLRANAPFVSRNRDLPSSTRERGSWALFFTRWAYRGRRGAALRSFGQGRDRFEVEFWPSRVEAHSTASRFGMALAHLEASREAWGDYSSPPSPSAPIAG
jgi:hypothetical protein